MTTILSITLLIVTACYVFLLVLANKLHKDNKQLKLNNKNLHNHINNKYRESCEFRDPFNPTIIYDSEIEYHKFEHYRLKEENALLSRLLYNKAEEWDSETKTYIKNEEVKEE